MTMRRVWGGLVTFLAATVAAEPAVAEPSGEQRALATELFKQGRSLMAEGDFAAACPKLAESQRLDPGGGTLLNLALCREQQGKTATAWTLLHEALGAARRDGRKDREELAREHLAEVEPRLCRVRILVPHKEQGLTIKRNGVSIAEAAWGVPTPVDPGVQSIVAHAPGHQTWTRKLTVREEGKTVVVEVPALTTEVAPALAPERSPEALPSPPAPRPAPVDHSTGWVMGWVLGGVSVASMGVGVGAGVVALQRRSEAEDACVPRCGARAQAFYEDGRTAADVSTFWLATGAVMLASSVFLLVMSGGDDAPPPDAALLRW